MPDFPQLRSPTALPPVNNQQYRWLLLLVALLGLMIVLACAGVIALALRPEQPVLIVTIVDGETAGQTETRASTIRDLLNEQGLSLNNGDSVSPTPDSRLENGMVVQIARARDVLLTVDGVNEKLQTLFTNPLDILDEAGILLTEADLIWVDGTPATPLELLVWPVPATQITVKQAVTVTIDDEGTQTSIHTASETVGEALFEAGVTLYLADTVSPTLNAPISANMTVSIRRGSPVSIIADGVTLETRAQGRLVADALASAGVALLGLDYAIPNEMTPLQPGMLVRVIRVTEQFETEQETIAFETVYQADGALELDRKQVLQEGQNGIRQTTIRVRYENGIEINRTPETESVVVEPVNRVINYGTGIVLRTVETPDGPREYWRVLRLYATSYHPAALGGDNITATGRVLTKGIVGINPTLIPYGTQLFVPGYGIGVAADTGGPRRSRFWIDLGYDDANWVSWSKPVDVYLLTPIPAEIEYLLEE